MSGKKHQNNTSVAQKANHFGMALFIFVILAGAVLWYKGNVHFGSHNAAEAGGAIDDEHQHGDENSQVTVWDKRFEIFLEHPLIAVNEPTAFVTHVSDLSTLKPRKSGPVTFILSLGSAAPIKHTEPKPARDGIYIPELTFPKPGDWTVSLAIPLEGKDHIIFLPPVKVYASHDEIHAALPTGMVDGISFLKEQQWKVPTKTDVVQFLQTGDTQSLAVPESAIVDEGDNHVVFVQLAGETFEKRSVELGRSAGGFVHILTGLSSGDRLVTKGADAVAEAQHAIGGHDHGNEQVVELTQDEIGRYAIELGKAGPGQIEVHISMPGQIVINTDRMAHIMPNAAGVVRQVFKNVGEKVKTGEILAWIESSELGKAKVEYLTNWAEVGCCSMDLTRARQISDSITELLETLNSFPSLETIRQVSGAALNTNHTTLISSYAELVLAKSAYEREKSLFEKMISSEKDYLTAENAYKRADAKYAATRDSIAFEVKRNLLEAQRAQQVRQIQLKGSERNLYVLGLSAEDINDIQLFAEGQTAGGAQEEDCDDPNCPECAAERAAQGSQPILINPGIQDEKLAWYPLRAPFDATVIEKHITLGEKMTGETSAYTVADLSTVWLDLSIYQKDLPHVKAGQQVELNMGAAIGKVEGKISYVGPIVEEKTRTAPARVVLNNKSGMLRPGTFVTAEVLVDKVTAKVVVPKDVTQDINDKPTVFVKSDHGFEARTVTLGRANDVSVEIVSGLRPGEPIVTKNSFRLKAELEKVAGGAHAGHGHVH
ncbi:MAG TPA: hypothetical protein DIU00_20925 [Phycisphaerales bacterium]|nr:hypothetical protein [Phycisphaerales bacterium]